MIFGSDDEGDEETGEGEAGGDTPAVEPARGHDETGATSDDDSTDGGLQEFETRLDDMEAGLEQTSASVRSIEGTQEGLSEEIEQLNDRVRQLLGMYDQAAADANPFSGAADGGSTGFGVVEESETAEIGDGTETDLREEPEEPEAVENHGDGRDDAHDEGERPDAHEADDPSSEPGTGFEQLKSEMEGTGSGADVPQESAGDRPKPEPDATGDETLATVPRTYAADIVVMEWLSMLIRRSGPAGALKSFEYYASVGWISEPVQRYLETMLSGPGVDAHVEPESPEEPRSADHLRSYAYIEQLKQLEEADEWDSA